MLAPDTADAVPAERGVRREIERRPDVDGPGLHAVREPPGPLGVGGLDVGREPVPGVVRHPDRLIVIAVVAHHGQHRAEDLVLRDLGVLVDVRDHRRLVPEAPAAGGRITPPAADEHPRAGRARPVNQAFHPRDLGTVDDRTDDVGRIGRIPPRQGADRRGQRAEHLVVARGVDDEPGRERATLAAVAHAHTDRHRQGDGQIGVVQDDIRRLPPEFQTDLADADRGTFVDPLTDAGRAGEVIHVHPRVARQRLARHGLVERADDVEHARRQIGVLVCHSGDERAGQRRVRGRLQHHGVTRGQCVLDLPDVGHERRVPWRDRPDHAIRLIADAAVARQADARVHADVGLPREAADQVVEVGHVVSHHVDVRTDVRSGCARLGDLDLLGRQCLLAQAIL